MADEPLDFEALERLQLQQWAALSTAEKVDFFEEMIQLAHGSGALRPERLALRDQAGPEQGGLGETERAQTVDRQADPARRGHLGQYPDG